MSMRRRTLLTFAASSALGAAVHGQTGREMVQGSNDLVLGQTGILTGPLGGPIVSMLGGARLAFDNVNAQGGIAGRRIRLVSLDDELKPDLAVNNYRRLLDEHGALAFFGCVGSGTTAAAASVLKDSGAPAVGGYAVADAARERVRGSAYFIRAGTGREAQALVQHLTTIGITRIAVAYLDNPGGKEALDAVTAAMATQGGKPVASAAFAGDASNVAAGATQLAAQQPQAVLMYLGGTLPGTLMKALWEAGSKPSFYGMSIVSGTLTAKVAGDRARGLAIAQVVPYPWGVVEPDVREYQKLAQAAKLPLDYYTFEGYLNARVMIEALRRAGPNPSRPRLHAVLQAMKWRVGGMDIDYTTDGLNGSRFVELVQVADGGRFVR